MNEMDNDSITLAATMFSMTLREVRCELGLDPNNAELNDIIDAIAALKKEVKKAKWETRSNKDMHPMDKYAVKKIRANIIAGNREQAKGYYFLDDWVLKVIENNELFPDAQPTPCPQCNKGVVVSSISSCQACYYCSNKECGRVGCSNGIIKTGGRK